MKLIYVFFGILLTTYAQYCHAGDLDIPISTPEEYKELIEQPNYKRVLSDFYSYFQLPPGHEVKLPPIHFHILFGNLPQVERLLSLGASVSSTGGLNERSPLFLAIKTGQTKIVELLLKYNAPFAQKNGGELDATTLTAEGGHFAIMRLLVEKGFPINSDSDRRIETPLHIVAERGNIEIASYLLKNGAKLDVRDSYHETPMQKAARQNYPKLIHLFLSHLASQPGDKAVEQFQALINSRGIPRTGEGSVIGCSTLRVQLQFGMSVKRWEKHEFYDKDLSQFEMLIGQKPDGALDLVKEIRKVKMLSKEEKAKFEKYLLSALNIAVAQRKISFVKELIETGIPVYEAKERADLLLRLYKRWDVVAHKDTIQDYQIINQILGHRLYQLRKIILGNMNDANRFFLAQSQKDSIGKSPGLQNPFSTLPKDVRLMILRMTGDPEPSQEMLDQVRAMTAIRNKIVIHNAIRDGKIDRLESFLLTDGNPDVCDSEGQSALRKALWHPDFRKAIDMVAVLLRYGANPNPTGPQTTLLSELASLPASDDFFLNERRPALELLLQYSGNVPSSEREALGARIQLLSTHSELPDSASIHKRKKIDVNSEDQQPVESEDEEIEINFEAGSRLKRTRPGSL